VKLNGRIILIVVSFTLVVFVATAFGARDIGYDERVYQFGHVGIGFKVLHKFALYNKGDQPYKIDSCYTRCSCSSVKLKDSTMYPGDTAYIELSFETQDYYGPTNKSVSVFTNYQAFAQHKFFYQAIVGQWFRGLKPDPISLFFLPGHGTKKIVLPNRSGFDISIVNLYQYDSTFTVKASSDKATNGKNLEFSVTPAEGLQTGTYHSNFTMEIGIGDKQKPIVLTIPVKIVRY